jgi:Sulfotransferase family
VSATLPAENTCKPLLLIGFPRSGTTWAARMLATARGATLVHEPDNEKISAPAIWPKRRLGRFPALTPGEAAPGYRGLWRWAFSGAPERANLRLADHLLRRSNKDALEDLVQGRPDPALRLAGALASMPGTGSPRGPVIVKSVHACLALDWLVSEFDVDILVLQRHPANVLSSWLDLKLPDQDRRLSEVLQVQERFGRPWGLPEPGRGAVEAAAWQVGLLTAALEQAAANHAGWHVLTHEQLCTNPEEQFGQLFEALGLEWGPESSAFLEQTNRPGSGFSVERDASELPDSWRSRLDPKDIETLGRVLRSFPIKNWNMQDFTQG